MKCSFTIYLRAYICACNTTPMGKFTALCFAQSIHLYRQSEKNLHLKCQDRSSIFELRIASMKLCFKEHHQVESLLFSPAFFPPSLKSVAEICDGLSLRL